MSNSATRRDFFKSAGASALGLGTLDFLSQLPAVSAAEAKLDPKVVRLAPDIEPLVRLLEETPRERLLEEVAAQIRRGTTYREVLAALLLAGVRNVEPRPSVGFKFHAVLVVNSAHLASLSSPDAERWLPIFWALDNFKDAQAKNLKECNGWRMPPVDETAVPPARKARQAFINALESWDAPAADVAIAGLVRTAGADDVLELFWRFAPRDFRAIGHKIIFAANAKRTLDSIGWRHAEPVLRSLAYALMSYDGDNPAKRDDPADRPGRRNLELAKDFPASWQEGKLDDAATADLLATLRQGSEDDSCRKAVELLKKGIAVQSIWDGLFAGSAELLMRKAGIVPLHALTTTNAIRYAYERSGDDATRRWLLLQNAAFVPMFRKAMEQREKQTKLPDLPIEKFEALAPKSEGAAAIGEIFNQVGAERLDAARKALAFLNDNPRPEALMDAARMLVFLKGNDSHDYKFSSAVLEDYYHVSPAWRNRYLAGCTFQLRGARAPDNALVKRTREALKA
jgi:hypothetical protein